MYECLDKHIYIDKSITIIIYHNPPPLLIGKLKLVKKDGKLTTVRLEDEPDLPDELVTVFENGELTKRYSFAEVRANAAI